jgi:hypothetical protein
MKELLILSVTLMGYFMPDGATPHAAKETIRELRGVFGAMNGEDRIIIKGLWPLDPQI